MNKIEKIQLFVNDKDLSQEVAKKVKESLIKNGFELVEDFHFDLGIAIGGDGTFLRMVKQSNFPNNALFVGINSGTLGFAQEIHIEEINSFIEDLKNNDYSYEEIGIGKGCVETKTEESEFYFLNEVAIRDAELNAARMDVYINDVLLENYVGDGLLIATSFGSTAYNLSHGGTIVYNTLHTLQITPIAPLNNKVYHSLRNSLIIPSNNRITLVPTKGIDFILTVDGDNYIFENVQKIQVSVYEETMKVIRKKDYNFIRKINDKFLK